MQAAFRVKLGANDQNSVLMCGVPLPLKTLLTHSLTQACYVVKALLATRGKHKCCATRPDAYLILIRFRNIGNAVSRADWTSSAVYVLREW